MATFTFGSISTSIIEVRTGTGTIAQLYADAIAHTPGCMTSPSADVYQVEGNRELELENGVDLDVGSDTLQWNLSSSKYPILEVQSGATLRGGAGGYIIGDINDTYLSYIYFRGNVYFQGEEGNDFTFMRYMAIYMYSDAQVADFDYVTLSDNTYSTGPYLYFYSSGSYKTEDSVMNFDNVTITDEDRYGYGIVFDNGVNASHIGFNNIEISNIARGVESQGATFKLSNCIINNTRYQSFLDAGSGQMMQSPAYNTSKNKRFRSGPQSFVIFDGCTFGYNYTNGTNKWCLYFAQSGTTMLLKNCNFLGESAANPATIGTGVYYGAIALLYGEQTFTNVNNHKLWSSDGTYLHVRKLSLVVTDGVDPIEDATVVIRQKEGKEYWSFKTNSLGEIKTVFDEDPMFVEKEESSNGVFIQWSDGTGNNVHIIEVSKSGYTLDTREISMSQDREVTVVLTETPTSTTIYDSTIYNSTIY